jgi:hypothetical protein
LVNEGIESMSLNPDTVIKIIMALAPTAVGVPTQGRERI